jgi:hypothetical protein
VAVDDRLFEHSALVRVQLARLPVRESRREKPLRYERGEVRDDGQWPDWTEEGLGRLGERLPTELICRDGLDERAPVEPAICIEERPPLGDKIRVPEVERTV